MFMKDLIQAHKKLIKTVKEQMGFSDYGMYWLAFLEGGLTIWLLDRIFFHWLKF
ncbi:protein family PM-16 [Prochlorococcus marinus str. MIT 9322]|uniref:Protein family PM-16 n=6 Tax=Prochlorococcus marinus TaxID=1219 RepID=A0A0A2B3P7_PROMR|nr:protein family PM-16 [Prochlorococcus marinus str. MIT 9322]KGG07254.1 protein family PM-16 [Prochlorococcus marinus str. MIT 9401]